MATTNVGKPFGVVTSKNQATAITESKQDANSGQFYITRTNNSNTGGVSNTQGDASEAISLTINGNVLRGISKADAIKLASLSTNTGGSISNLMVGAGLTKTGNTINLNLGSGLNTEDDSKLRVKTIGEIIIDKNNNVTLDVNELSGTTKDPNLFYYSKGGIYFGNTIKSGQKFDSANNSGTLQNPTKYMRLRCGTGLKFQEGYFSPGDSSNQVLGHDGRYYVNIDNKTIVTDSNGALSVKKQYTIPAISTDTNDLTINMSTTALLVAQDAENTMYIDFQRFKFLVKLALGMS